MIGDGADWKIHSELWRDPAEAVSLHRPTESIDRRSLAGKPSGHFWPLLGSLNITLLVGREYEHFVLALSVREGRPFPTYMPLPHPAGIAVDRARGEVFIASTRNPNQIFSFQPLAGIMRRDDRARQDIAGHPLMPVASRFLPGSLYIHELAMIQGQLYANAAGHNAIVRIGKDGYQRVWWPRGIERQGVPDWTCNHIQLNSIAAGRTLQQSYFSASSERIGARRPGQRHYPVDRRGVIFSAATREPVVRGLTRPHSARLWRGRLWVNNSGYGQFGVVDGGSFVPIAQLPGWTRGLTFRHGYAFVGVSRVIPRFRSYAPGLDVAKSVCGVFVLELSSGNIVASLLWPNGNQIFAVDWISADRTSGFPFSASLRPDKSRLEQLYYAYELSRHRSGPL